MGVTDEFVTPFLAYISLYGTRARLAKLGYTSQLSDLDCYTAEMLIVVDSVMNELANEDHKRMMSEKK